MSQLLTFGVASQTATCAASPCRQPSRRKPCATQASCNCQRHQLKRHHLCKERQSSVTCAAWGFRRRRPLDSDDSNSDSNSDSKPKSSKDLKRTAETANEKSGPDIRQSAARTEKEDIGTLSDKLASTSQDKLASQSNGKDGKQQGARGSSWSDWEDWDPDWEGPPGDPTPADQFRKNNPRRGMGSRTPRDEYLRPMIDTIGIQYRLGFKRLEAEERVETEFLTNQWESREAVKFGAILLIAPILTGWILGAIVFKPVITVIERVNPHAFEISEKQKLEGAKEVHKAEMRMRMDAAIGRAPPLSYTELQAQLRVEAHELLDEFIEKNKHNVCTAVSDSITGLTGFGILLKDTEGRGILFRTLGRIFSGLSDTAKAFLIIATTDILLGYHSEEGWTAVLHIISDHYGAEIEEAPIYTFVAIVPVTMDALFKYWIFKGLNRQNPAAAATLKQMDRH